MAETTHIEWCHATFNPWIGCTRVSPACDDCYAARSTPARALGVKWGTGEPRRRTSEANWRQPLRWNRKAGVNRERWRVFCASLADWLDNEAPLEWLVDLLDVIRRTPNLDWLLLTKRIGIWRKRLVDAMDWIFINRPSSTDRELMHWIAAWLDGDAPHNVWIGSTVINQEEADRDIPKLLATSAEVRFLSIEPMLGPINLHRVIVDEQGRRSIGAKPGINWVICGGESGRNARPLILEWVRSIVKQCKAAGVPVLVKQLGAVVRDSGMSSPGEHWPATTRREPVVRHLSEDPPFVIRLHAKKGGDIEEWPEDLRVREFPA